MQLKLIADGGHTVIGLNVPNLAVEEIRLGLEILNKIPKMEEQNVQVNREIQELAPYTLVLVRRKHYLSFDHFSRVFLHHTFSIKFCGILV